jgi:hypothetical protein
MSTITFSVPRPATRTTRGDGKWWSWLKKVVKSVVRKARDPHFWINVGTAIVASTIAVSVCAGTLGVGGLIGAGAGIDMLVGTPAHLFTAYSRGEKITAQNGFGWLIGSGFRGGWQSVFRLKMGAGPAGYVGKILRDRVVSRGRR